eukprot:scaffold3499_cov247-Pinguiococcus_pyrenoidosus.AAC.6
MKTPVPVRSLVASRFWGGRERTGGGNDSPGQLWTAAAAATTPSSGQKQQQQQQHPALDSTGEGGIDSKLLKASLKRRWTGRNRGTATQRNARGEIKWRRQNRTHNIISFLPPVLALLSSARSHSSLLALYGSRPALVLPSAASPCTASPCLPVRFVHLAHHLLFLPKAIAIAVDGLLVRRHRLVPRALQQRVHQVHRVAACDIGPPEAQHRPGRHHDHHGMAVRAITPQEPQSVSLQRQLRRKCGRES